MLYFIGSCDIKSLKILHVMSILLSKLEYVGFLFQIVLKSADLLVDCTVNSFRVVEKAHLF